jgi:very-short-patch-repair endonuclease
VPRPALITIDELRRRGVDRNELRRLVRAGRHHRPIVEVDGLAKYADRTELQREKERQNRLIAAGYTVSRFIWADVTRRPEETATLVRRALAAALPRPI